MQWKKRRWAPVEFMIAFFATCASAQETPESVQESWFTTSGGAQAPTPPVLSLDCPQMARVLVAIDQTGYRRGAAKPDHEEDFDLLRYENSVARRYYIECVGARGGVGAADGAFSGGYDGAGGATERR